jgi:glycosyltransferase involved in cell wall biosynthesis
MIQPVFSIFIPTYNRVNTLLELLNKIHTLRQKNPEISIEVIVADNASSDKTFEMMQIAANNNFIDIYIRRSINMGPDFNMLDCFNYSHSDFVWILCDDDLPTEDSFLNIFNCINSYGHAISLIYLNGSTELMTGEIMSERLVEYKEGIESSKVDILKNVGIELLRASTLVFRKTNSKGFYSKQLGLGKFIAPLTLALDAIENSNIYIFNQPQVRYREGDKSSWVANWPVILRENIPEALSIFCKRNGIDINQYNWLEHSS